MQNAAFLCVKKQDKTNKLIDLKQTEMHYRVKYIEI